MKKLKRMRNMALLAVALIIGLAAPLYAQQPQGFTVKGKVLDNEGPMPGVSVVVKGSTRGVITDPDGAFSITGVPANATLQFRFVGYKDLDVAVKNDNKPILVVMESNVEEIGEVVVTAFGTQKKESAVSSIESVRAADLKVPSANLTSSFAGRIPGLIAYQTSGEPGRDDAQFFVRGVTTFGYKQDPLIIIDGFEASTSDLARLQVDDIDAFSVLKDASAAVTYGSRAANGIIIVTTKQGKEGPVKISGRIDGVVSMPTKLPELLDAVDYMRMYNFAQRSRDSQTADLYSEQQIQSTLNNENPMIFPDVDWYGSLFKNYTFNQKANLNVSGGGKVATYYVAVGYDHETGLLKVDNLNNFNNNININRFHLRNNVTFKVSPTTSLATSLQARFEKYNGPFNSASNIWGMVVNSNPVDFPPVYEPDEALSEITHTLFGSTVSSTGGSRKTNPYAEMVRGYSTQDNNTITASMTLSQDLNALTKGLRALVRISANTVVATTGTRSYDPKYYTYDEYDRMTNTYTLLCLNPTDPKPTLGNVSGTRSTSTRYYGEARLNWDRDFGKHTAGAMLVGIFQESLDTGASGDLFSTLPERNLGLSGRFTYGYDARYFLEASFGYNGSEKFTGSKQFGLFPSIGVGWVVSNEDFWAGMKGVIDNLKFKGTYGIVGNDAISGKSGRFWFLSNVSLSGVSYTFGDNDISYNPGSYTISRYANPNISWEQSYKTNIGVELGLLKDSPIKIQFDVFRDIRDNIYMQRSQIPQTAGFESSIYGNNGKVKSQGLDGSLDLKYSFSKDWWMTGRFNYTYAVNEYVKVDEPDYVYSYKSAVGHNINQRRLYAAERLFIDAEEVYNSPTQSFGTTALAGDIKYHDINGDGVINDNDVIFQGYPSVPEIQYGFGLSTGYKRFDFSFFFTGNTHTSFMISPTGIEPFINQRNALKTVMDRYWDPQNPDPHAFWPRLAVTSQANNTQSSSWWMRNGGFLRLKTVEMGYNLDLSKIRIASCRIYVIAQNLFAISPFKLWDPEMGGSGLGYPLQRQFSFGVNFSL
jgi:TonB-linked SusC/RagA family outer membrane protein